MARTTPYYVRKTHRWLGVLLGLQFLMWTLGGLYFSWTDIDEVHGDFQKKPAPLLSSKLSLVSPSMVIDSIKKVHRVDSVVSIQLIELLGQPYYQIRCMAEVHVMQDHSDHVMTMNHLAHAATGRLRGPLSPSEAVAVAKARFNGASAVRSVRYLTQTDSHHEYRENPLPAYAVSFDHPSRTTVYVSSELGTVQKFRNDQWRFFDFLWMMHTMDYQGRDNFGNLLLRAFSIFGLCTVLSGFALFFISSKSFRTPPKPR